MIAKIMKSNRAVFISASLLALTFGASTANAALDLKNASVQKLDNGLTVILLEDRNFPVASVQMLYRVGARDEVTGKTGLAHFLEHMAFRNSENFLEDGLTAPIYARGGEWHGYTWTDQTTYFATVPKEHLDLLLRIEADRMARLTISPEDMDAERGAVLAEMHMYENYPTSMLIDAVVYTSFLAHPYRNNTIGWQSDIEKLKHKDVVDFYESHYHPANGVLVIVGDIDSAQTLSRVTELFGDFPKRAPTALPHTLEPDQQGERRVRVTGSSPGHQFMIAYRAPAANDPDFPAFLVAQSLLGASSGVNFNQNDWGTPVRKDSVLHGAAAGITTWYPPSAQKYVFVIGGFAEAGAREAIVEQEIERRIESLRRRTVSDKRLSIAVNDVLGQLVFDVETTEEAAHQLAYFEGLGALETLLELPDRVAAVTPREVKNVVSRYLLPERRSIAWYETANDSQATPVPAKLSSREPVSITLPRAIDTTPLPPSASAQLSGGIPVIVQTNDLSPSAYLQLVFESARSDATANKPALGFSALEFQLQSGDLEMTIAKVRASLADPLDPAEPVSPSTDPETRLEQVFGEIMAGASTVMTRSTSPVLVVVSGDVAFGDTMAMLEKGFGKLKAPQLSERPTVNFAAEDIRVNLGLPIAQAQLGYIVPAAAPSKKEADAQRLLLYILSHGYDGRLGKIAISDRGLAYYIDSRYRSDGNNAWITLGIGVDVHKLDELKALLESELQRLRDEPPTTSEFEEAKTYLLGRARSAAQSNEELATTLAQQRLWHGETVTPEALVAQLATITYEDLLEVIPALVGGTSIVVTN